MMRRQRSRRESAARRSLTARAVATMAALLTQLIPPACGAAISAEPWQFNQGHPTDLLQQHLQHSYELDWRVPADGALRGMARSDGSCPASFQQA